MSRPGASAALLSLATKAAPARLVKKLDANLRAADAWAWAGEGSAWSVTTDSGETVTITGALVTSLEALRCTCLLSPRCFHVLAVAAALAIDEGEAPTLAAEEAPATPVADEARVGVSESQRDVAREAWLTAARVLSAGASASGAVLQGELLRSVHAARTEGLHRLGAAGLRVVRHARELQSDSATFSATELQADVIDLLATAWALARGGDVEASWIGVARRAYEPLGSLRVSGLFAEPIVAANGFGGVVTHLVADDGRFFTLSDVMPGGAARARGAYDAGASIGDATLAHRELVRAALFVQGATGSRDGRLGSGAGVKAVRTTGSGWGEPPVASRFDEPIAAQIARASSALEIAAEARHPASTLIFARLVVLGADDAGILARPLGEATRAFLFGAPFEHRELAFHENLRRLASPGLAFRAIARLPDRGERFALLAVGPDITAVRGARALALPEAWAGVCNLGFDVLQGANVVNVTGEGPRSLDAPEIAPRVDPLVPFSRRVLRAVLGGRASLPQASHRAVAQDASRLTQRLLPTAASLLAELARAALPNPTKEATEAFARAWLSCATYERGARRIIAWE